MRPSQELISPVVLHRTKKEAAILKDLLPALAREGFILEGFGGDAFLVRAVPVVLGRLEETTIIDEIISDLVSEEASQTVSNRERITRTVACRGAVKAGTVCTREQCQRIVDQLRRMKNPFTCPHGRPTMIRFSKRARCHVQEDLTMAVSGMVAGKVSLIQVRIQWDRMKGFDGKEQMECFCNRIKMRFTGILSSGNILLQSGLHRNLFLPQESAHLSGRILERQ